MNGGNGLVEDVGAVASGGIVECVVWDIGGMKVDVAAVLG